MMIMIIMIMMLMMIMMMMTMTMIMIMMTIMMVLTMTIISKGTSDICQTFTTSFLVSFVPLSNKSVEFINRLEV